MRRPQPGHRVGDLVLGGEPLEELRQGTELVAGVSRAVPLQQPGAPLLHVLFPELRPASTAGLPQVGGGEPLHRLGVGPDRLGGLAFDGQVQPERADLRLEDAGVQLLGLPEPGLWCGHVSPFDQAHHHPLAGHHQARAIFRHAPSLREILGLVSSS